MDQVTNGIAVRMAILYLLINRPRLEEADRSRLEEGERADAQLTAAAGDKEGRGGRLRRKVG
jgi:hypothetical protein